MRRAGRLVAATLEFIAPKIKPGISGNQIDAWIHEFTLRHGARPAPLNYKGFPKSVCTSINDCVCHGIPDDRKLSEGDIINIDVTSILDGYFADASHTFAVGNIPPATQNLLAVAYAARHEGITHAKVGARTGAIGHAISRYVHQAGLHICPDIGGHGIGKVFHDDPFVPSYGQPNEGSKLKPWRAITIEPIINLTANEVAVSKIPNSSIKVYMTSDGSLSAQFEHTILLNPDGVEVLTQNNLPPPAAPV